MVKKSAAAVGGAKVKKSLPVGKKSQTSPALAKQKLARLDRPAKAKKVKLVWDSFTMPAPEYQVILTLKKRCLQAGLQVKKSEILRAAVARLSALNDATVITAIRHLEGIKADRPRKKSK